jgi:hypothetical protein
MDFLMCPDKVEWKSGRMGLGWWKASRRARVALKNGTAGGPTTARQYLAWPRQLRLPVSNGAFHSIHYGQASTWKFSGLSFPGLKWQERQSVNK